MKYLHVVAAVIQAEDGKVFLARRPVDKHQGGLWEFPGGKLEPDETPLQGLDRELQEETGINILAAHPLIRARYSYPDKSVLLDVWKVTHWSGEPAGMEGQETSWFDRDELDSLSFPAANLPVITAVKLPSHYVISPSLDDAGAFLEQLAQWIRQGYRLFRLRNSMQWPAQDYYRLAVDAGNLCEARGAQLMIDAAIARQLWDEGVNIPGDWGIHFRSAEIDLIDEVKGRLVAVSCHNEKEVYAAAGAGADFITLSPVNATASHPQARPLGWDMFASLADMASVPVYALGGLEPDDLDSARENGAQGVAGIRCFLDR